MSVIILFKEGIDTLELKYKWSKFNLILVYSNSNPAFCVEEEGCSVSQKSPNSFAEWYHYFLPL